MKQPSYTSKFTAKEKITFPPNSLDYELIDCGNQRKLERFGKIILDRPEIEAKWIPKKGKDIWSQADWYFYEEKGQKGKWNLLQDAEKTWEIQYKNQLNFQLKLTQFKHVGIFPEQAANWSFIEQQLAKIKGEAKVLNLFAYTGAASIVAAKNGANVTNVDSVKQVLNWGRENAALNGIDNIRWILEDAQRFVDKSLRREDRYHGIIMDPPAFGLGNKKEQWKLERDLPQLLKNVCQLLDPKQQFFILNTYSPRMPMKNLLKIIRQTAGVPQKFEASTLALLSKEKLNLPLGNLIRWSTL